MRRTLICIMAALALCAAQAQPGWVKKAAKAVFTLKTFDADGNLIASSNGFFVGEQGEALSSFAPFKGAARAVVIDTKGNEMPVASIIGANSTYDVAKFRVEAKSTAPLAIAAANAAEGSAVWLLPYSTKKSPDCIEGRVSKIETFQGSYAYYTVGMKGIENSVSCPLFNANGEVIGLIQQPVDAKDTTNYAVSAAFANSLKTNGLSINDATLNSTSIKKELPDELNQAVLTLYVADSVLDSAAYAATVNDFIAKFPNAADGYISRAQLSVGAQDYAAADADMQQAIKVADKKDDAHFNYAKLMYQKLMFADAKPYDKWTFDAAAAEARAAYDINKVSLYRQLEAQIRFAQKRYDEAYSIYSELLGGDMRNAETYFAAARCKEMMSDTTAMLALLDSAVNTFSKPYLKSAAPYILARAQALLSMKEYRKAVVDFNEYEKLMPTEVNANFYYIRARAEIDGHIYQAALNDLATAIGKDPKNTLYYCEKASLEIRVNLFDDAIKTAGQCIAVDPKLGEGYMFLGLAQCLKGDKATGRQNLQKAKDLGDTQAQELIDKYAN